MNAPALTLNADLYPQRRNWRMENALLRFAQSLSVRWRGWRQAHAFAGATDWEALCEQAQQGLDACRPDEGDRHMRAVRRALRAQGLADPALISQAVVWVARHAQSELGLQAYPHQMQTACLLLSGFLVELDTGEGKSLVAALAAAVAAWAGQRVHVITVNDYLVERDENQFRSLFKAIGLSSATVLEDDPASQRVLAYRQDVVYLSNKTVTFDYLRDRTELQDQIDPLRLGLRRWAGQDRHTRMSGLVMAIVDEADSVLIDEALTPLILSATVPQPLAHQFYRQAMACARQLRADHHYLWDAEKRELHWLPPGLQFLAAWAASDQGGALWLSSVRRQEVVMQALTALHRFNLDVDYIVRDGQVQIVDVNTGRVMPDRAWESGLHQMIELKEGLTMTDERVTLARISYQQFFPRYLALSGMTGTCREVTAEVARVYGLPVVRVEPRRPSRRRMRQRLIHADSTWRWQAVCHEVGACVQMGQPVLVGTRSIQSCEHLSHLLRQMGIAHQVLHARQDANEAALVARAGEHGQVTLCTNMGGRGTDIRLGAGVSDLGGLHVVLTELHDSPRIDRQLVGRCARQGDPGSWSLHASLDDVLFEGVWPLARGSLRALLRRWPSAQFTQKAAWLYARWAQFKVQRLQRMTRLELQKAQDQSRQALAYSGVSE